MQCAALAPETSYTAEGVLQYQHNAKRGIAMKHRILIFALLAISYPLLAEEPDARSWLEAPQLSTEGEIRDGMPIRVPHTVFDRRNDVTMEKYGINHQVFSIKVTPVIGYPYYLSDDNDSNERGRHLRDLDRVRVPEWRLFDW